MILKLNLRTTKLEIFQERLNTIKQQSLFHVEIHSNENFVLPTNELSLSYDFEHQQCVLTINCVDDKKIINQYFYKQSHLYDPETKSIRFNDRYHTYTMIKLLSRLQKMDNFTVNIDAMFETFENFEVNYDFKINQQNLKLRLDINQLDKSIQLQIFKAYNKQNKFFGLNQQLYDLETLDFSSLKNTVLNFQNKQSKVNPEYEFDPRYLFFLETRFSSPILKKFVSDFSDDIKSYKLVAQDFMPSLKSYQLYGVN